jgi:hypothetical protein
MVNKSACLFVLAAASTMSACKAHQGGDAANVQDAGDVQMAHLPDTVAYQWSCAISTRTDADTQPQPPTKPVDFPSGQQEVYLALEHDTFYFDKDAKFFNDPANTPPESWVPDGFSSGPGYKRYKINYSFRQQMAQRRAGSDAPTASYTGLQFSGLLSSGYFSGSFYALPGADGGGASQKQTYDCYQKKWWPLSPTGW